MAEFDLTFTLAKYLDKHMVLPLLEFLFEKQVYDPKTILRADLEILSKTKMVDMALEVYQHLENTDEIPEEMLTQREKVFTELEDSEEASQKLMKFLEDTEHINALKNSRLFNREHLNKEHRFSDDDIEQLVPLCKFRYECGRYLDGIAETLQYYRELTGDADKKFNALWGMLAAWILRAQWNEALRTLDDLVGAVQVRENVPHVTQLQQRAWLIHWGLFIYFNLDGGRNLLIDFLIKDIFLNTIQTQCPHILRYLAASIIVTPDRNIHISEIVRVIEEEKYSYSDPITEFLRCLKNDYDFEKAEEELKKCEEVLENDFFLNFIKDDFLENAKLFYFETFCGVHKRIDVSLLAERLNMDKEQAEEWVVGLIKNSGLDAKIDCQKGHLVMGSHAPTIYQQVIDKTKQLARVSGDLVLTVEQRYLLKSQLANQPTNP